MQYCFQFDFTITLLSLLKIFSIMDYDYLFYEDLPKGVKSVYVNGKRMSLKEFNQHKKNYLSKKLKKIES